MDEIELIASSNLSYEEKIKQLKAIKEKDVEDFKKYNEYYTNYAAIFNENMAYIDQVMFDLEYSDKYIYEMLKRQAQTLKDLKRMLISSGFTLIGSEIGKYTYYLTKKEYAAAATLILGTITIGTLLCSIGCLNGYEKYKENINEYSNQLKLEYKEEK